MSDPDSGLMVHAIGDASGIVGQIHGQQLIVCKDVSFTHNRAMLLVVCPLNHDAVLILGSCCHDVSRT